MNKLVIFSTFIVISSVVFSQQVYRTGFDKHELSVALGGGLSGLNYNPVVGDQRNGFGGNLGFGYHYFISPYWSLRSGIDFALYNSKFEMKNVDEQSYIDTDYDGANFIFHSSVSKFSEKQRAFMLQIPVMAQYQTGGLFYAAAGFKVGLPLGSSFKSSGTYHNSGYYERENFQYDDDPWMGFTNFNRSSDGSLKLKVAFMASAEAGVRLRLKNMSSLYIGAYIDYGLNNINKASAPLPHFVDYQPDARNFSVNSVVQSQYAPENGVARSFTDKLAPLAVGINCRLSIGAITFKDVFKKSNRQTTSAPRETARQQEPQQPQQRPEPAPPTEQPAPAPQPTPTPPPPAAEEVIDASQVAAEAEAQRQAAALIDARSIIERPTDGYEINDAILDARQLQEMDEKIALLHQYSNFRIYINGHTCDIGTYEVNQRVGMERAQRARDYLIANGIAANRILTLSSKRDTEPLVPNIDEENRRINRRVQLLVE